MSSINTGGGSGVSVGVSRGDGRIKEVIVDSRISKVLAMRTDSVTMLEALDAISEFYVSSKYIVSLFILLIDRFVYSLIHKLLEWC